MLILSNLSGPVKNLTRENPIKMPWYLNTFLTPGLARIKNDIRIFREIRGKHKRYIT
jgi:hypothetical protein